MNNYIVDQNRFKLAGPPQWFLRQLWEFDNSLVIVPSRQAYVYRLAQRRKLKLPENIVNDILFKESDTRMLASYGLVPITSILATVNWSNPLIFNDLRLRAPWRNGGADEYEKKILAQEAKEEMDRMAIQDDKNTIVAKDAWGMYLKKVGLRSNMYSPRVRRMAEGHEPKAPAIIIP